LFASPPIHGAAGGQLERARIGLTREASAAPLLVAIAAGYFTAEGVDPQVTFVKTDAAVHAAVASGKVDIGMAGLSAPFYNYAAAHGLKMIASRSSDQTGFPMYALLVSRKAQTSGFTGVRGLSGARIGIAGTGSGPHYALFNIASRFGLRPGSIETVSLTSPAGELEALSRGDMTRHSCHLQRRFIPRKGASCSPRATSPSGSKGSCSLPRRTSRQSGT